MKYYLDSNICIFFLRNREGVVAQKIASAGREDIKIPSMVKGELLTGAMKSARREQNIVEVMDFLDNYEIVPFDSEAAEVYGEIKSWLELRGTPIGFNDMIIAATALANNGILVTNNTREFSRIPGLMLDDWTQA